MTTPTVQPSYGSYNTITCGVASLATSSTFVAGREATAIDNTSNLYTRVRIAGKITVGTTPTVSTQILIFLFGRLDNTPTWPDVFTGSDANATLTSVGVGQGFLKLCAALQVDSTSSNRAYPFDFAADLTMSGFVFDFWSLFVTHNTGVNLNSTAGNHVFKYQGGTLIIPSI